MDQNDLQEYEDQKPDIVEILADWERIKTNLSYYRDRADTAR